VVIEVGTLNRGDAVGGLEVIGPPSMADAAPAPRAHAQAPVRARKPISLIFEVPRIHRMSSPLEGKFHGVLSQKRGKCRRRWFR
jgi:hypothetical protein